MPRKLAPLLAHRLLHVDTMAQKHGKAGHSTYLMSVKRAGLALLFFAMALGLMWFSPRVLPRPASLVVGAALPMLFGVVAIYLIAIGKVFVKRSDRAERGADAEVGVAQLLQGLPAGYHALHDLTFDGFNIDHVVIGPTGVFTIETKSHRGRVSANGDDLLLNGRPFEKHILKQAWSEAYALRDLLQRAIGAPCAVQPILCFPKAFVEVRRSVKGVIVASGGFLPRAISARQGGTLSQKEIHGFVNTLRSKVRPLGTSQR